MIKKSAALFFFLTAFWAGLHLLLREKGRASKPAIIAHRGAAGLAPENTLAAIRVGLAHQAPYIEIDVQRSADGMLVVIHDETIDRTSNGRGPVRELSWAELRRLDAGSYFDPHFAGETIPTLSDVLLLLQDKPATLVIEIKDPHFYPDISQQILALLAQHQMQERVVVISFDHAALETFHRLAPGIPIGLAVTKPWPIPPIAPGQTVDVFWPGVLLDPTFVYRMHRRGYTVWVWTVNAPALMRLLAWLGVDGLTTDHPQRASRL
ncbi:MAG: glycerophosphodiester phosphodiesterase [Anaerolineae bacterium]|nr:glycerophosphodiester phosphodiesterase [Anaerolineae bacterium]